MGKQTVYHEYKGKLMSLDELHRHAHPSVSRLCLYQRLFHNKFNNMEEKLNTPATRQNGFTQRRAGQVKEKLRTKVGPLFWKTTSMSRIQIRGW